MAVETATFAAGCFWGVEEAFRSIPGVISTEVGYTGGRTANPAYGDVCRGGTGHAEAVNVVYDTSIASYESLLDTFWGIHDPTTRDRQGPDVGNQYRSALFYHSEGQRKLAEKSRDALQNSGKLRGEIVTEIVPAGKFWRAEEYHQHYLLKNGGSCHAPF